LVFFIHTEYFIHLRVVFGYRGGESDGYAYVGSEAVYFGKQVTTFRTDLKVGLWKQQVVPNR
jgi:hypothetical protein